MLKNITNPPVIAGEPLPVLPNVMNEATKLYIHPTVIMQELSGDVQELPLVHNQLQTVLQILLQLSQGVQQDQLPQVYVMD